MNSDFDVTKRRLRALVFAFAACLSGFAFGQPEREDPEVRIIARETIEFQSVGSGTAELHLVAVRFAGGGWERSTLVDAFRQSAAILAQCGMRLARVEFVLVDAPHRFQIYSTLDAREFARRMALPRPTVYFVRDTANQPAFDAEAIGRSNSRTRPELTDSVWVTRGTRDLGIALTHELMHLLMDSGAHIETEGNLMRAETAPENTLLDPDQCAQGMRNGKRNGLVQRSYYCPYYCQ